MGLFADYKVLTPMLHGCQPTNQFFNLFFPLGLSGQVDMNEQPFVVTGNVVIIAQKMPVLPFINMWDSYLPYSIRIE